MKELFSRTEQRLRTTRVVQSIVSLSTIPLISLVAPVRPSFLSSKIMKVSGLASGKLWNEQIKVGLSLQENSNDNGELEALWKLVSIGCYPSQHPWRRGISASITVLQFQNNQIPSATSTRLEFARYSGPMGNY